MTESEKYLRKLIDLHVRKGELEIAQMLKKVVNTIAKGVSNENRCRRLC